MEKTLGNSLQPRILEWILFGATVRRMERGIWLESDKKEILLGKVTNYFTNLQAAEFKLESFDLKVGDEILIQGPTTGTIQMKVPEIRVDLQPVEKVEKGILFSVQVPGKIRRGDKLYKWVDTTPELMQ